MGWNQMQQAEKELKKEDYWKGPEHIIHKAGLKALIFGEPESGNGCQHLTSRNKLSHAITYGLTIT